MVHPLQPSAGTGTGRIQQDGLHLERTGQEGGFKKALMHWAKFVRKRLYEWRSLCDKVLI